MNPVMFFDELDKISDTKQGEEIVNILMQITDPAQNDKFHDSYFSELEFDLSRCIVIFTYNDESLIHPVLKDRMIRIETKGYTTSDKIQIAQKHLVPSLIRDFNMKAGTIDFTEESLRNIIEYVESEQGVRNMKRAIHDLISNMHLNLLIGDISEEEKPIKITRELISKYVYRNKPEMQVSYQMIYI
jgi:ATP-dependent Lon protease